MTRQQAIDLLLSRAQPLPAETDPIWEELADYLEEHPDLAEWFSQGSRAEVELRAVLQTVGKDSKPPVSRPVVVASRRTWLRAAASIALVGTGVGAWLARPVGYRHATAAAHYADFCEDMGVFADRLLKLDHKANQLPELSAWLAERALPGPEQLPAQVAQGSLVGCKAVRWGQRDVGLVCFRKQDGSVVHIFTLQKSALSSEASAQELATARNVDGREIVGWQHGQVVSILVPAKRGVTTRELLS
jgi:hypothetical protein